MPITLKEITNPDFGAQFYAGDLHIHSFEGSSDVSDKSLTVEAIIELAFKNHISIICITDHNTAQNVDRSIEVGSKYAGQMLVLAGAEITTANGHLLVYFSPDRSAKVQDLLGRIEIVGKAGGRDSHTTMSMADVIKEVERLGGLAIAAHVDRANTGFEMRETGYPHWKGDILSRPGLYGLEFDESVHLDWYSPEDEETPNGPERRKLLRARASATAHNRIAALQDSDARALPDLQTRFVGQMLTKFKMNELTFEAFRTALVDPEARIRAQAAIPPAFPRIVGMHCEGGFLDGQTIHFSSNLNCFIGGRGTGKSTAIRSLAYALGIDDAFEQYDNCPDVTVVYCEDANGIFYRYERQKGLPPVIRAKEGDQPIEDVPADSFRIEFYGQGALAEVAKDPLGNPSLLQQFLDKHISLDDLRSREEILLQELAQNSAVLKPIEASGSQLAAKQTTLAGLNTKLKAAESGKVKEIAALQNQLAAQGNLHKSLSDVKAFYETGISMAGLLRNYDALAKAAGTPTGDQECKDRLKDAKNLIDTANTLLKAQEEQINTRLREIAKQIGESLTALQSRHSKLKQVIDVAVEKLRKQGLSASVNELNTLIKQRDLSSGEVSRIVGQQSELQELRTKRTRLLSDLAAVRHEASNRRKAQLKTINDNFVRVIGDYFVALYYESSGIVDTFRDLILSIMQGTYFQEETAGTLCSQITPEKLADLVKQGNVSEIAKVARINITWAHQLLGRLRLIENLHKLETVSKPPLPVIKVLTKSTPQRQIPVQQLSDGQKHTILLTIAMLAESNVPLVMDQPEDDLDNAFIFASVVATLRRIKEHRQLVIVTHNANIAVLGDSELLLPLKRTGENGVVYERGSIDRKETSAVVQEILEGGPLAFRRRKEIYGH